MTDLVYSAESYIAASAEQVFGQTQGCTGASASSLRLEHLLGHEHGRNCATAAAPEHLFGQTQVVKGPRATLVGRGRVPMRLKESSNWIMGQV